MESSPRGVDSSLEMFVESTYSAKNRVFFVQDGTNPFCKVRFPRFSRLGLLFRPLGWFHSPSATALKGLRFGTKGHLGFLLAVSLGGLMWL